MHTYVYTEVDFNSSIWEKIDCYRYITYVCKFHLQYLHYLWKIKHVLLPFDLLVTYSSLCRGNLVEELNSNLFKFCSILRNSKLLLLNRRTFGDVYVQIRLQNVCALITSKRKLYLNPFRFMMENSIQTRAFLYLHANTKNNKH